MIRLCFVCLGNICRSPTADGIMRALVAQAGLDDLIQVDSAGTAAYHAGEAADTRSRSTAEARGVPLPSVARQFVAADFQSFDYVLAMDQENFENLQELASDQASKERLYLFRSFDPQSPEDAQVPDPYYGGPGGFDEVFDICQAGCQGLLAHVRSTHCL